MSKPRANQLRDSDIVGLKSFDRLTPLLERLHDIGAQRDRAGNRQLFFDPYYAYILLFLFNPSLTRCAASSRPVNSKKYRRSSAAPAPRSVRSRKPSKSSIPNPSSKSPANWPLNSNRWATIASSPKSSMRLYEMICISFIGWADEEELPAHLEKLKAQDA
jgi:hypothetical protein